MDSDSRQVRSLRWLMFNGTNEDRSYSQQLYEEILIDLWKQHVFLTGDTYYPPLQNELYEEHLLESDNF